MITYVDENGIVMLVTTGDGEVVLDKDDWRNPLYMDKD